MAVFDKDGDEFIGFECIISNGVPCYCFNYKSGTKVEVPRHKIIKAIWKIEQWAEMKHEHNRGHS